MDTFNSVVGVVGGVLGILSFFLPIDTPKARRWHAAYVAALVVVVWIATNKSNELKRLNDIAKQADALVSSRKMDLTDRGYVFAALAFLEKNKDAYPDSYARAIRACQAFKCEDPSSTMMSMGDLAFTLNGIVKGIGSLSH